MQISQISMICKTMTDPDYVLTTLDKIYYVYRDAHVRAVYSVVGGYAVGYYGYPRATGDMDIWIAVSEVNAKKTAQALRDFGMPGNETLKDLFIEKDKIIRLGVPPVRIGTNALEKIIQIVFGGTSARRDKRLPSAISIDKPRRYGIDFL